MARTGTRSHQKTAATETAVFWLYISPQLRGADRLCSPGDLPVETSEIPLECLTESLLLRELLAKHLKLLMNRVPLDRGLLRHGLLRDWLLRHGFARYLADRGLLRHGLLRHGTASGSRFHLRLPSFARLFPRR